MNKPEDYSNLYPNHNPDPNQLGTFQQSQDYRNFYQSSTPLIPPPKEPKPRQPFSPVPLLLIAGVIFLFLGGIIFLTKTWDMLPDILRAMALLSASAIAFGVHVLAEKIFRLQKTSLAFYILGCIFLPLALGGIGVFHLFGDWLSFAGDGGALLWMLIFLSVSVSTFFGQRHYQSSILVQLSLGGLFGAWISLDSFVINQILSALDYHVQTAIFGILLIVYAGGAWFISESYLRQHDPSYITKAIPGYLYAANVITALFLLPVSSDAEFTSMILYLILAILFSNSRFIAGKFHIGVFGSVICLLLGLSRISRLLPESPYLEAEFLFPSTLTALILMSLHQMPKLRTELTETYSKAAILIFIPAVFQSMGLAGDEKPDIILLLYFLLMIAGILFIRTEQNKPSPESRFFMMHLALAFNLAFYAANDDSRIAELLLIISALLLMIQAFLKKKLWPLVTAISTSAAILIITLNHADIALLWLCTLGMLTGVIYANLNSRYLLEKCCAWCFLAFLPPTMFLTADSFGAYFWTENCTAWILIFAVLGILYLLETFVFRFHIRTLATRLYLEAESCVISIIAFISYLDDDGSDLAGVTLFLLLLLFAGGNFRNHKNTLAVPQLIISFFTFNHVITSLNSTPGKVMLYLILLGIYAGMGRLLLNKELYQQEENKKLLDWPLIIGIFPVLAVAITIDWYPSILTCLFLSFYSLLYIGRVQNRETPMLLASAFACLSIFFHNIHDPFEIFQFLQDTDMKTPQILLYLFPVHLFILSLLWILPNRKATVHDARFIMYCFTMLTLLIASLSFGNASDAILLMLFSFAIVFGSFKVRKLRWFALGFAVLFLTTIRLTWQFWTSLHWGIYLFLAGIVLIAVASFTEYKNRYRAEHPDEPEKKLELFKSWTW